MIRPRLSRAATLAVTTPALAAAMLELDYEMTYKERIEGPLGPTTGSPRRLCWKVAEATLVGPRIHATLAMPGVDWIRLGSDGIRRQDQRAQFLTQDGALVLLHYDTAVIRGGRTFLAALDNGDETAFADQYICMAPQFEVGSRAYEWLTQSLFIARGRLAGPKQIEYQIHRVV
jgi:hypothetical protein